MAFSFFGGVHPAENKLYARDKAVQAFPEPDVVVIPMSQHIGAPCKPLVKKNDLVKKGQKIGDHAGLCAPVHAPVSGKVKSVEMKPHTSGTTMTSVVIENDRKNTVCPDCKPRTQEEVEALSPAEKLKVVQNLMKEGDERAAAIYDTIGAYFGYAIAFYAEFYDMKHVLIMGRVTSGEGGVILLERAKEVLAKEFPALSETIQLHIPDENSRRVGQSVAAASLPATR